MTFLGLCLQEEVIRLITDFGVSPSCVVIVDVLEGYFDDPDGDFYLACDEYPFVHLIDICQNIEQIVFEIPIEGVQGETQQLGVQVLDEFLPKFLVLKLQGDAFDNRVVHAVQQVRVIVLPCTTQEQRQRKLWPFEGIRSQPRVQ